MAFSIAGGIIIAGLVIFGFFVGLGLYAEGGAPGANTGTKGCGCAIMVVVIIVALLLIF
jgi:hypothetical protein